MLGSYFEAARCTGNEMVLVEKKASLTAATLERLGAARDTGRRASQVGAGRARRGSQGQGRPCWFAQC